MCLWLAGDKQLGVLPLDPLKIENVKLPKNTGPVSVDTTFKDLYAYGIKDIKRMDTVK